MRGFIGLCLLSAGLAIGAYSHYPGTAHREAALVELTEIVTGAKHSDATTTVRPRSSSARAIQRGDGIPTVRTAPTTQRLAFANAPLLTATIASMQQRQARRPVTAASRWFARPAHAAQHEAGTRRPLLIAAPTPAVKPVAQAAAHPQSWRTAVVPATSTQDHGGATATSLKPMSHAERWKLAKALQRELKRVGCYWGKVDGVWGKGSKWAMADFMRSVNAALPANDPDYLLLRLVSSHTNKICGRTTDGTQIAATTRTPLATQVASASPSYDQRIITGSTQRGATTASHHTRPAPLPGRMAVGALTRDQKPKLIAPPTRIQIGNADNQGTKRVRVSALPNTARTSSGTATDTDPLAVNTARSEAGAPTPDRYSVPVATQRAAKKIRRDRALKRAAVKKKRRRYRRGYRRRSLQSLFMHPLGRR